MAEPVMKNDYNDFSQIQKFTMDKGLEILLPFIEKEFQNITDSKIVIGDYGCAGGKNSLTMLMSLYQAFKKYSLTNVVHSFLTDLPGNNYNAVFQAYQNSSLYHEKDFFLSTSIGSFYHQILPPNSVHVACSFTSLHWVSPTPLLSQGFTNPNACYISLANPGTDATLISQLLEHSKNDMKNFLVSRSKELISGGLLFFCCPGYQNLFPSIHLLNNYFDLLQKQLNGDKNVTEQEISAIRIQIPVVYRIFNYASKILQRTKEHFHLGNNDEKEDNNKNSLLKIIPFFPKNKEMIEDLIQNCPELSNQYQILYSNIHDKEDLFWRNYLNGQDTLQDRKRKSCGFFRAWSESSFRELLNHHEEAIQWFYQEIENHLDDNLLEFGNDSIALFCCLKKK